MDNGRRVPLASGPGRVPKRDSERRPRGRIKATQRSTQPNWECFNTKDFLVFMRLLATCYIILAV